MDIKQLRYFVQVAEMGSVSKAAAALSIAQPAISRQIRNLEESLGRQLLHRNGRGVTTTEAGVILLDRAKGILEDLRRTEWEMREMTGIPTGKVTLGVPPTVSQVLVIPLIKRLRDNHPNVTLQVIEAFSGYVREWLATGRADLAVLYDSPRSKHLVTEKMLRERLFLVTAATGKAPPETIALRDVAKMTLILPSSPHGLRLLIDQFAGEAGITLQVGFEIDALSAIKELVEEGVGATILPFASVSREALQGRVHARQIIKPVMDRTLVFATTTQRPSTLATRAVIKELKEVVQDLVSEGLWKGAS